MSSTRRGADGTAIAVGGELSVSTPDQHGLILIRGDDAASFTFDGQQFPASGMLRMSLGGAGQGG